MMPLQPLPDDTGNVGGIADRRIGLARRASRGEPTEAGADRIDQNDIGDIERGVVIVDDGAGGSARLRPLSWTRRRPIIPRLR